jgi:hypothetical protein
MKYIFYKMFLINQGMLTKRIIEQNKKRDPFVSSYHEMAGTNGQTMLSARTELRTTTQDCGLQQKIAGTGRKDKFKPYL